MLGMVLVGLEVGRHARSERQYRLQIDLVQEFVAWFEQRGADRLLVPVVVEPTR
jgi:hypothetical protein